MSSISTTQFAIVDSSYVYAANVGGDANDAANTLHTFAQIRADAGWATVGGNSAQYTGSPDSVTVMVDLYFEPVTNGGLARIGPVTEVFRNGVSLGTTTSYARHATGHNRQANVLSIVDDNPGANPVYTLVPDQGSGQDDVLIPDFGRVNFIATERVEVRA